MLDDHQTVLTKCLAALDEIDDEIGQARDRGQLDRALHVDDFDGDTATSKVSGCDVRELRSDAKDAWRRLAVGERGDDHPAATDAEIHRRIEVVLALEEHVAADDAEIGG